MLDRIQGSHTDSISQSTSLDKIQELELKNHYKDYDSNYIIDESRISDEAYRKYQREIDVKNFSNILLQTSEKEATELVLQKAFDGTISINDDNILNDLISNNDLLNEIIWPH